MSTGTTIQGQLEALEALDRVEHVVLEHLLQHLELRNFCSLTFYYALFCGTGFEKISILLLAKVSIYTHSAIDRHSNIFFPITHVAFLK